MGWERRPKLQYPAPHTGHHSPCGQSSGDKRGERCVRSEAAKNMRESEKEIDRLAERERERVAEADEKTF